MVKSEQQAAASHSGRTPAQEAVIRRLHLALGDEILASLTAEQKDKLEHAVILMNVANRHVVDVRKTFGFSRWRYYVVFLLGRDRRTQVRREGRLSGFLRTLLVLLAIGVTFAAAVLVLYLIKSALGIDIFKDYSFGIWDWFRHTVLGANG